MQTNKLTQNQTNYIIPFTRHNNYIELASFPISNYCKNNHSEREFIILHSTYMTDETFFDLSYCYDDIAAVDAQLLPDTGNRLYTIHYLYVSCVCVIYYIMR